MSIQSVLFDLDGTLLDTAPELAAALNTLRSQHGQAPLPLASIRAVISQGSQGLIRLGFGISENDQQFMPLRQQLLALYAQNLGNNTPLFPGIAELLAVLEEQRIPWGIVTNKLTEHTQPLLQKLQLAQRTICVVSGDTLAYSKPHPAPLLYACELLQSEPKRCIYLGDAQQDVLAGNAASMTTLIAAYGYLSPDDQPEAWSAAGIIQHPQELLNWLN
jgi:phosphoglycolate phosphatase